MFKQVNSKAVVYQGFINGQLSWKKDHSTGELSLADESSAAVWRGHSFQQMVLEYSEFFRDLVFRGNERFAGKEALKLNGKDFAGTPVDLFFDEQTDLFLGFSYNNPSNTEVEPIRIVVNEWKQIGNRKLPSKVTASDKKGDFVLNFWKITLNEVDETIFSVPPKISAERELLEAHKQARAAHFARDAKLLVAGFADDFSEVRNGNIRKPTRDESLTRFQRYLSQSTFLEWEDISPPVIKVSDDATMAYSLVHKKVRLLSPDENGKQVEETEVFAWMATYRKLKGEWKLTAMASTNTPEKE
jgi:hypothetical protein